MFVLCARDARNLSSVWFGSDLTLYSSSARLSSSAARSLSSPRVLEYCLYIFTHIYTGFSSKNNRDHLVIDISPPAKPPMSLRTFTVFQDAPSCDIPKPKASNAILSTSSSLLANSANLNNATTLTTAEKENLHPLTGERAGPSNTNTKKRKTSVLATKVHLPLGSKKQKELKEAQPDAKKRKSSSTSTAKPKSSTKKDGKASSSSRKGTKKPSRRVSPMPKLNEEAETDREHERIIQADIDSRCYELTVRPLADVSQAYEQSASLEAISPCGENTKFQPVKVR